MALYSGIPTSGTPKPTHTGFTAIVLPTMSYFASQKFYSIGGGSTDEYYVNVALGTENVAAGSFVAINLN